MIQSQFNKPTDCKANCQSNYSSMLYRKSNFQSRSVPSHLDGNNITIMVESNVKPYFKAFIWKNFPLSFRSLGISNHSQFKESHVGIIKLNLKSLVLSDFPLQLVTATEACLFIYLDAERLVTISSLYSSILYIQ